MRTKLTLFLLLVLPSFILADKAVAQIYVPNSHADEAYIFAYATDRNAGRNGLHLAWSSDLVKWHEIGPEYAFVKSDYGAWGSQKRMLQPRLMRQDDGSWVAIWRLNEQEDMMAVARSRDLVHWVPQDYYPGAEVLARYTPDSMETVRLPLAGEVSGDIHKISQEELQTIIDYWKIASYEAQANSVRIVDDGSRFPKLSAQKTTVSISADNIKTISDNLMGIFFEDINYAADGGLYAELVQNRDFEYSQADVKGRNRNWNSTYAWNLPDEAQWSIDTADPIHPNNPHYLRLNVNSLGAVVANTGFDGIVVKAGEKYDFSAFVRKGLTASGKNAASRVEVRLTDRNGEVLAKGSISSSGSWKKRQLVLTAAKDCNEARLELKPLTTGCYEFDMVSLFPQKTFKGRKNGLRPDLAQVLADMKPRFVRFPGGCVAHGNGIDNIYRWKNTIGPLEARVPMPNTWNYHQSMGLGYFEYFQLCEDLGAEPLPVIAAGVPCQNSSVGGNGQQGGIPMDEMEAYIQDIVDLVEWANGDPKKSKWAKMRADAGHPEPFNLKYIGIGNEDLISEVFKERFTLIFNALKQRCPEITVVGTVGPFWEGSDYETGWQLANELQIPIVDEHYYNSPGWYLNHQDYYDSYRRGATKVYLGEFAAHNPQRSNCLETALSEALHLCNVERNADVVEMVSYAPLFGKKGYTQWNPNLIYFTNTTVEPTTGYYVHTLFGQHSGDSYLHSEISMDNPRAELVKRVAASVVSDSRSGDLIVKAVNILPVENEFVIELPQGTACEGCTVEQILLSGDLADAALKPVVSELKVQDNKIIAGVPAYSFVVWRIRR